MMEVTIITNHVKAGIVMTVLRSTLIALVVTLTSLPTLADESLRVEVGGWGKHPAAFAKDVTNETFDILAVEWKGVSFGRFNNSFSRETYFVAKNWRKKDLLGVSNLNAVASLGLNKGYRVCYGDSDGDSKVCPHGYVGLEYEIGRAYVSVKTQVAVTLVTFGVILF